MSVNGISVGNVGMSSISGLDLESALMAVQTNRANQLENQLKSQIDTVQAKNDTIAKLNEQSNAKRGEMNDTEASIVTKQGEVAKNGEDVKAAEAKAASQVPANEAEIQKLTEMRDQLAVVHKRDPNGYTGLSWGWASDNKAKSHEMGERLRAVGIDTSATRDVDRNGTLDAHGSTVKGWMDQLNSKIADLQKQNQQLKDAPGQLKAAGE